MIIKMDALRLYWLLTAMANDDNSAMEGLMDTLIDMKFLCPVY